MDLTTVCMKLAEHWERAAKETANDELRACYASRAHQYLELATRERNQSRAPRAS